MNYLADGLDLTESDRPPQWYIGLSNKQCWNFLVCLMGYKNQPFARLSAIAKVTSRFHRNDNVIPFHKGELKGIL